MRSRPILRARSSSCGCSASPGSGSWRTGRTTPRPGSARRPPKRFNGDDPASYPSANWTPWTGSSRTPSGRGSRSTWTPWAALPLWALGPGRPKGAINQNWEPSPRLYEQFVHALGVRYSGNYNPVLKAHCSGRPARPAAGLVLVDLERARLRAEPRAPGRPGPPHGREQPAHVSQPGRRRVDRAAADRPRPRHVHLRRARAAWTELLGRLLRDEAARVPAGDVLRRLELPPAQRHRRRVAWLPDDRRRQRGGSAPRTRRCSRPAAFSDHPYMRWYPPNDEQNPDPTNAPRPPTTLARRDRQPRARARPAPAARTARAPASRSTTPSSATSPRRRSTTTSTRHAAHHYPWVTQSTAAYYLNWAEYISWKTPGSPPSSSTCCTTRDPPQRSNDWGGYASGLLT